MTTSLADNRPHPGQKPASPRTTDYPLQGRLALLGVVSGLLVGTLLFSPIAGFAVFTVLLCVGALWRRDELPVLAFCVGYQWLFAAGGYLYLLTTGRFPQNQQIGDVEGATLLSLIGLLVIVAGIRIAFALLGRWTARTRQAKRASPEPRYSIRVLFLLVMAIFAVEWFTSFRPSSVSFQAAQLIYSVLAMRYVALGLLFYAIFQQRRGHLYGLIAAVYVLIPQLTTGFSGFREPFFLLFLVVAGLRQGKDTSQGAQTATTRGLALAGVGLAVSLVAMGLFWEGVAKPAIRPGVFAGAVTGNPVARARSVNTQVSQSFAEVDWNTAAEHLASRLGSGIGYFSNVLDRVPDLIPYQQGRFTRKALELSVEPRVLFPTKPVLENPSEIIRTYAGISVASSDEKTSVGIGYIAEFYIDYGVPAMFVPLLLLGLLIGTMSAVLLRFSPSYTMFLLSTAVVFVRNLTAFESSTAYMLGGLLLSFLVLVVLLIVVGPLLHRLLVDRGSAFKAAPVVSSGYVR